jgi:hypothetical protein
MFLPICLVPGCNSKDPWYPCSQYVKLNSIDTFFDIQFFNWAYLFGLLAGLGALIVAWTHHPKHFRTLWGTYAISIVTVVLGMWSVEGKRWREQGLPVSFQQFADAGMLLVPTIALLATLIITYFNCRTWFAAALWVQLVLAALACAWFGWVAFLFQGDLLIGGKVAIAASFALLISTVAERYRGLEVLGVHLPDRRRHRISLEISSTPTAMLPYQSPV